MFLRAPVLLVVDMQRYYLEADSAFARFHHAMEPGCLAYIHQRCQQCVLPNVQHLIAGFQRAGLPILFLRLCGERPDRSDLQQTFRDVHRQAERAGYPDLYPLRSDPYSEVYPTLTEGVEPRTEFCKTTFSAFTSAPAFAEHLASLRASTLVFSGLATSQCVETTARDAADRDFLVVHIEDAQADYTETSHRASLYSSRGVCGGQVRTTADVLRDLQGLG